MEEALYLFVRESNWIEGIKRDPRPEEVQIHKFFLEEERLDICLLEQFVSRVQPDARLRDKPGMNVRVGEHVPPFGGENIRLALIGLIDSINRGKFDPFQAHVTYETIHPFTDGNGRSGRALWLRMMGGIDKVPLGFLHTWYYQSLQGVRK